ncbi:hypothetical protein WJX77_002577 [Trebouxia sp. C0004]
MQASGATRERRCKQQLAGSKAASGKWHSAGFPEIEADTFLDWNSQATGEAPVDHTLSAGHPSSDAESALHTNAQNCTQQQHYAGSLIWESAGLAPRLKLPVLVNPAQSSSNSGGVPSLPPDMPTGPSIATARVKHPLSSNESAALTQLRAELSALFAEANQGPDLSLVPLPRQLNQAMAPTAGTDIKTLKAARPSRPQPRAAAAIFRRRRYTADAAVPNAMRVRHSMSAEMPQPMTELSQQGVTHPAMTHHHKSHQAETRATDSVGAAASAYAPSHATTQGAVQPSPKSKKYGRCNSWAASSPTRTGLTQNGPTSTSYSKATAGLAGALPGNLTFSSDFEGGNIGFARAADSGLEYDINVRQDTYGPKHRLWFHFQMRGGTQGQRVVLNFVNFSKARALYRCGMTPLVRSESQPQWARLPPCNCFYYKSPRHRTSNVLSVLFTIDRPKEVYEFAYTYPYSYTKLQRWLLSWERLHLPYLQRHLLCRSPQMKRIDALVIEEVLTDVGQVRPMVFVTARVHPGETPASFVANGLVDWLLGSSTLAVQLRRHVTIVVVPMLNPDGVFLGNYRTDAGGLDMNRLWGCASQDLEPALYHVLQLLHRYDADPAYSLDVFLDIHGHSASRCGFLFSNPPSDSSSSALDRVNRLPQLLEGNMPGYSLAATRYDEDARKIGCARRVVGSAFKNTLSYTLEISMFNISASAGKAASPSGKLGSPCSGSAGSRENSDLAIEFCNTPEGYCEMGKQLGVAFAALFSLS